MKSPLPKLSSSRSAPAFSLVELLTVVALIAILAVLLVPAFPGAARDMSAAADSVSDVLQQARTRAMSKNTYVYVGLSAAGNSPTELAVAVLEARDGMASGSNDLNAGSPPSTLQPLRKTTFLRGVRLDTAAAGSTLTGPWVPTEAGAENLEDSLIQFPANLVTQRSDISGAQFDWVIQFSPDGAARLDATKRTVPGHIFLGLVPAAGNAANSAGVIIDGPSGVVRVLRPGV